MSGGHRSFGFVKGFVLVNPTEEVSVEGGVYVEFCVGVRLSVGRVEKIPVLVFGAGLRDWVLRGLRKGDDVLVDGVLMEWVGDGWSKMKLSAKRVSRFGYASEEGRRERERGGV